MRYALLPPLLFGLAVELWSCSDRLVTSAAQPPLEITDPRGELTVELRSSRESSDPNAPAADDHCQLLVVVEEILAWYDLVGYCPPPVTGPVPAGTDPSLPVIQDDRSMTPDPSLVTLTSGQTPVRRYDSMRFEGP